ncbi:hypothetical protein ABZ953_34060 [Streptomyces sp. NPDC046465]|uniref:hypothetical protein n=1 Tax=Streptomyces sp. NPDC046465 TaxID=3155810 RepID=UPI0033E6F322
MKELIAIAGWILGVQGALGVAGRVFDDEAWGVLQNWWHVPTPLYVVLFLAGTGVAFYGEAARKRE